MAPPLQTCLPALGAALLAACAAAPTATPDAGFGPAYAAAPAPAHPLPVAQAPRRIAPGYLPARSVPMPKAVALQQVRIDALDPAIQNYEVELDLLRAGAHPGEDELFAVWMTGRPGAEDRTLTEIALARSADGGRSFARLDIESPVAAAAIPFDPVVQFDPGTQRTFVAVMEQTPPFTRQLWVARSLPGEDTAFETGRLLPLASNEIPDKGWLAAGPDPQDPARGVVYLTTRAGVRLTRDGGESWEGPVALPAISNLLQPTVLADGTLLVAYLGTGGQALLVRSEDGGRTYSAPVAIHTFVGDIAELSNPAIPGTFRAPPTTTLAAAPGGRLYAVLHDITQRGDHADGIDVLLLHSDDRGRTWSTGRNVTADSPAYSDQFLPTLAVDASGALHLAYFDAESADGTDAHPMAYVKAWYARSDDAGATWSRTRLTATPIDTFGTRWAPTGSDTNSQFLGDYFTLVLSPHAAYVAHPVHEDGVYGMAVSRIEAAGGGGAIRDPRGLSGLWYEPATSGQGFAFQWIEGDALALSFYGHRDDGANLFLTGVRAGRFAYGETLEIPLTATSGGRFNDFDRDAIRNTPWGRLTLRFHSCTSAFARLEGADGSKEMQLVRLAVAPSLPCD